MTEASPYSDTSSPGDPLFDEEQAFLRYAASCLEELKHRRKDLSSAAADKKTSGTLWKMTEEQRQALSHARSLAVGRIDRADGDRLHIGPRSLWDGSSRVVVTSWAATAAQPYFEASPENPMGVEQKLTLRADFDELLGVRREQLTARTGRESVPVVDEILLAELARHRSGTLAEVVATIQRDQYRIIRAPSDAAMVVQGGPGTGKTVVGLHRAAFILYRARERREPSGTLLIVGPNPLFMDYIRFVLPSLGETAADQVPVRALSGIDPRSTEDRRVSEIKARPEMATVLLNAVKDRVREPTDNLEVVLRGARPVISPGELADLLGDFDPLQTPYRDAREAFRGRLVRALWERAGAAVQRELSLEDVRTAPDLQRAMDRIWPTMSSEEIVRQLLSSEDRLERACTGIFNDVEQRILYRRPVDTMEEVQWTPADCALVDEVRLLVEGNPTRYAHVVLDEAQDLTPMELRMVGRRVRRGAVTILGDLAQATGTWEYDDWAAVTIHLGVHSARSEELTFAYRVPSQIMDVAIRILAFTAPSTTPPKPYRPGTDEPAWVQTPAVSRASSAVTRAQAARESGGTVAIITPRRLLDELRHALATSGAAFDDADEDKLGNTIELLDATQAKGLEFDHVVLVEPAAIVREHADGRGLRALYVALTRPTKSLVCVYSDRLPWPLGGGANAGDAAD